MGKRNLREKVSLDESPAAEDDSDASFLEKRQMLPRAFPAKTRSRFSLFGAILTRTAMFVALGAVPSPSEQNALRIFFVDVEGGQATLFVTPQEKSLLIDTGWPGNDSRDADRIVRTAREAGVSSIDYVLLTHFHMDHAGGLPQLVARFPVGEVIDHGDNREGTDAPTVQVWKAYQDLLATKKIKRVTLRPGDRLPVPGIEVVVLSSDGVVLNDPLQGAGRDNTACLTAEHYPADQTENGRSLGTLITFHRLRILDLGDLTRDKERELVCPTNKIGKVEIYIVSHHGWDESNSPVFLNAISPRVAIMDNGAKKGGSPSAWSNIERIPSLENLWQLHFSEESGSTHNVAPEFIANLPGPDNANYLELTAWPDGSFEVFNSRTQNSKKYATR